MCIRILENFGKKEIDSIPIFCDDFYMALELGFILWKKGKYYIVNDGEQEMEIKHCPFCDKKHLR